MLFLFLFIGIATLHHHHAPRRCSLSLYAIMLFQQHLETTHFLPPWLQLLLTEKFFNACLIHEEVKKNEKNAYCLDCCDSLCIHCLSSHCSHRVLQIRRYVYHDVVRLENVQNLFDCSYIQFYTTNSAKVIFLNPRPNNKQFKFSGNICNSCSRSLQEQYLFCSIACKTDHIVKTDGPTAISSFLFVCKILALPEPCSDDGLVTPESISIMTSFGSGEDGAVGCRSIACTATTEFVRKKRSSLTTCRPRVSATFMNRRKTLQTGRHFIEGLGIPLGEDNFVILIVRAYYFTFGVY